MPLAEVKDFVAELKSLPGFAGATATGRGISLAVRKRPELAAAVNAALDVERDLKLVHDDE